MISPSVVISGTGAVKCVKNLGWLLRNWMNVDQICVTNPRADGEELYLVVYMRNGSRYETGYADLGVFQRFIARPVFIGCTISSTLSGHEYTARKVTK